MARFNKLRFASIVVILAIINVMLFTIVNFIFLAIFSVEATQIMPYFFGFWTCEIVMLAAKRIFEDNETKKMNIKPINTTVSTKTEGKG